MALPTGQAFEFGDFRLDFGEKTLSRFGELVPITPKVFETLYYFLENAGRLVEKDEIMQALWQDHFVEESNLTFNVMMLRKALDDDAAHPCYIETVQRRGYRFIASVHLTVPDKEDFESSDISNGQESKSEAIDVQTGMTLSADDRETSARFRTINLNKPFSRLALPAFTVVLLLSVLAVGIYFLYARKTTYTGRSIAILPFKPITKANRDDIYDIGIPDSLILKLSSMDGFKVRQLSAIRRYTDIDQDPLAAGQEQKVDYVLESHYQLVGGKIKVTSQLISVATGKIEETYKSEQDAGDVFSMQDSIAGDFGNRLSARFALTASGRANRRGTTNAEAYRLFLQGMFLLDKRDPATARNAITIFERAVLLDPNFPQAWAGIAHAHRLIGGMGRSTNSSEEYKNSMEAIGRSLALDENLADAHSAICDNKTQYEWDFDGAERECRRAIELDPSSGLAHQIYSRLLMGRGRFDEAISEVRSAMDLEPTSLFNQRNYGVCLYFSRRFPEAVTQLKKAIEMDPNFTGTNQFLIQSLEMQGNYAEAFDWLLKLQASKKEDPETIEAYGNAFRSAGWQGVMLEQAKRLEESNVVYFHVAVAFARAGNTDKAFEYLDKSYQRRELWMHVIEVDPGLDSLRSDPRFGDLVKRVGSV